MNDWHVFPLGEVANISGGITLGRKTKATEMMEVPYLCVANVQDGHLDLREIKRIGATAAEVQLRDMNLLRMRVLKEVFSGLDSIPAKRLGDFAETRSGSTPARGYRQYWHPAEIPWVKTAEVAFAPITETEEAVSGRALAECSLTLLPPKTVLSAMYGQGKTRGQSAILDIVATTNQACFAIMPNDTWKPEFLYLWLRASYQDLRDLSEDRGGNQANLNGALLKVLVIPAPDQTVQTKLVKRVVDALAEIDALENACKSTLEEIDVLPARILGQAFGDTT